MLKFSICKSILRKRPPKIKVGLTLIRLILPAFFVSSSVFESFYITGQEDKIFHALIFGTFAYMLSGDKSLIPLLGLFFLGLGVEFFQGLSTERSACIYDLMANTFGLVMGRIIYCKIT